MAQVSQTTVSFVVNHTPNVSISEETRSRVWSAVEELGYRPNAAAQSLRRQKTNLVGFVTDQIATTPHAGQVVKGAQEAAWAQGKILLLVNTDNHEDLKKAAVEMMLDRQVDGIIYATMYHREARPPQSIGQVPVVLLDCFDADGFFSSVVPNEQQGGRVAIEALLKRGHRRIGFINNSDPIPAAAGRLAGYRAALAAEAVPFDPQLVRSGRAEAASAFALTRELMSLDDPPTALFCFNDSMAMGAYDALRELGKDIPDDVAVIGFDNHEIIAAHLRPALTSVQLPHYEMGFWAVDHLLELVEKRFHAAPVHHLIDCPLVLRASI